MTENEQKQQLSVAFVHAIAACAGYTCQVQTVDDDSVDVSIGARGRIDDRAIICSPRIDVQLKATSSPRLGGDRLTFSLKRKNYDDLRAKTLVPRLLVVLALPEVRSEWIETSEECMISRRCAYWASLSGMEETNNTHSVSVYLARDQRWDVEQLRRIMGRVSRQEPL